MRKTKLSVSYVSQIIKKLETLCYEYDFFLLKLKSLYCLTDINSCMLTTQNTINIYLIFLY